MCGVNHQAFARPGYLIDIKAESVAPAGALFTRMLAHHSEIGLTSVQIQKLLDLSKEYHDRQLGIRLRMAELAEKIEHKFGRITPDELAARKIPLDERRELFREDEELFFEYAQRGHELLDDEQIAVIDAIYHGEKDEGLSVLAGALASAVGPSFVFCRADRPTPAVPVQ